MRPLLTLNTLFLATGLMLLPPCAKAAAIFKMRYTDGSYMIHVGGMIKKGDAEIFAAVADQIPPDKRVEVVLTSGGGTLSRLEIGRIIHRRKFRTVAIGMCASLCADIWLAGEPRILYPGAAIGFRAFRDQCKDTTCEGTSAAGNAVVGAYLNELGFKPELIWLLTKTPSSSILWMTPEALTQYNISYTPYTSFGALQAH
jgi:hypothetical protein